ncbi:MAG: flagellar protein FlaG [Herminiimonas sp.]|nr:flagellar protein FlaG [Herminiimonas sp.]
MRSNPPAAAVAPQAKVDPTTSISPNTQSVKDAALNKAVDAINRFINPVASSIQFSVDEDSGRTLVKVVDTDTNTVLRQFPSKEALAISHELDKLQGLLVKDKA